MFDLRGHGRDNFTKNLFKTFDTDKSGTIDFRSKPTKSRRESFMPRLSSLSFREFMLALAVISRRTPEDKLVPNFTKKNNI